MKLLKPRFNLVNARQSFNIRVVDNCNSLPASLIDTVYLSLGFQPMLVVL